MSSIIICDKRSTITHQQSFIKMQNKQIIFQDLAQMDYKACWDYQAKLLESIAVKKLANRKLQRANTENTQPLEGIQETENHLLFVEHPHVYTLGKSGAMENVLLSEENLQKRGIQFYKINRGGDITYHGPGQIVGYPILDLENFFTDIHKYLRLLEEVIIRTLAEYGVKGDRLPGATGVWLDPDNPLKARKICAMGIRCSRWITMHGWAFNVNADLDYFQHIVPCGITDKAVTSLNKELGLDTVPINEVKEYLKKHLKTLFEAELI